MSDLLGRDLYVEITDPNDRARPYIVMHRVWDADRFMRSLREQHNNPKVKPEDVRVVAVSSHEAYTASQPGRA